MSSDNSESLLLSRAFKIKNVEAKSGNRGRPKKAYSTEDLKAAIDLWEQVKTRFPFLKVPNTDAWAHEMRLMREQDGRTHEQILGLFEWANHHTFWQANIRSPRKLRLQWDELTVQRGDVSATGGQDDRRCNSGST